jgi:outer membrane protein
MRRPLIFLVAIAAAVLQAQTSPTGSLTLAQAEAIAMKNHPQVAAAMNEAAAAGQRITEAKSAYYPTVNGELTGSQALDSSRLGAGFLTTSSLFNRFGTGLEVSQLVTDLGRTKNLVANSKLQAQAADQNTQATRFDVALGVTRAYFGVLQAQALVKVADETIKARQTLADQVTALANAQLKSQLDVSFAKVNVSQARVLLIRAQDSVQRAYANLASALGEDKPANYQLSEDNLPPKPPADAEALMAEAIQKRPELRELLLRKEAAQRFEAAERDLSRPNVSVLGVGGALPYLNQTPRVAPDEYEAVAVNVDIPIFNGHQFSARRQAAHYETLAVDQRLRGLRQSVERDVRSAWASATTAWERIPVTEEMVKQAQLALDLAQGRYNLGLGSIVEVTEAQLNLTQAQIENLAARYDYHTAFAELQYTTGALR